MRERGEGREERDREGEGEKRGLQRSGIEKRHKIGEGSVHLGRCGS